MRFFAAVAILSGSLALAGTCPVRLETSPHGGVAAPVNITVAVRAGGGGLAVRRITLGVRIEGRWETTGQALGVWENAQTATASFPVNFSINGMHLFTASAECGPADQPDVISATGRAETRLLVMIPWQLASNQLPWFFWQEAEKTNFIELGNRLRGGQPMAIEGLVTGLAAHIRDALRNFLLNGYLNRGSFPPHCPPLSFCYSVAPVHLRLYAMDGSQVQGFFREGPARLGHFIGIQDGRAWDLGGRSVAGVMIVRGFRHEYILLSEHGDFSDEAVRIVEMPRGGGEMFRRALALIHLQHGAREVRP